MLPENKAVEPSLVVPETDNVVDVDPLVVEGDDTGAVQSVAVVDEWTRD